MRALLFASNTPWELAAGEDRGGACLVPFLDRSFLQHVVEAVAARGARRIDLVIGHRPEQVERLLGDGSRWGVKITFHLVRSADRLYSGVAALDCLDSDDPVLVGHADRLPSLPESMADHPQALFDAGEGPAWTGWAVVPGTALRGVLPTADEAELERHLGGPPRQALNAVLDVRTPAAFQESVERFLVGKFSGLLVGGREAEPGAWLSRNVSLHPTAQLTPPVYIGEDCDIGPRARLGPNVVVGAGCVLDEACAASNAVVLPGSYVGPGLELEQVVIDRNRLIHVGIGTTVEVTDDFILSAMHHRTLRELLSRCAARTVGALLLLLALPLLLPTAGLLKLFRRGPVLRRRTMVRLPAPEGTTWKTFGLWSFAAEDGPCRATLTDFFLRFLPGLVNVARGELRIVGVQPRGPDALLDLPHDWRALVLQTKAGLLTEAWLVHGDAATEDDQYSAEAFYAVSHGLRYDGWLAFKYLLRALRLTRAASTPSAPVVVEAEEAEAVSECSDQPTAMAS